MHSQSKLPVLLAVGILLSLASFVSKCGGEAVARHLPRADVQVALRGAGDAEHARRSRFPPLCRRQSITVGDVFYVELWATTLHSDGLSQVTADVHYDSLPALQAEAFTHGELFNVFVSGSIDNSIGLIDDLGGAHPLVPLCEDHVGASEWVHVAGIAMRADRDGSYVISAAHANSGVFLIALCGILDPPSAEYGEVVVTITGTASAQPPLPEDSLAITDCENDDDCPGEARCLGTVCYAPKHRYISIALNPDQVPHTARRVSLHGGAMLGWLSAPFEGAGLVMATVDESPAYADMDFEGEWPEVVHVTGCEIASNQTYVVQAIASGVDVGDEGSYSDGIALHTPTVWGDVVATCFGNKCTPPDGAGSIDDLLATIGRFQGIDNGTADLAGHRSCKRPCRSEPTGEHRRYLRYARRIPGEALPG